MFFLVHDFTQKFLDHDFSIEVMIFKLRDESTTDEEMGRQCPTPKSDITIVPVDFRREKVKSVQTPVVQEPILISESTFNASPPTIRSRIRDRFQGRIGTNSIEDFLISRHQRRF